MKSRCYYPNIKFIRQSLGLSQREVAIALHLPRQQYQVYESGKRDIPARYIKALAEFYSTISYTSADDLLGVESCTGGIYV